MHTPERSTAAAFTQYTLGEVVQDSVAYRWPGLFARRMRFPEQVECFLVPAVPEPLLSCMLSGVVHFEERDVGGAWIQRELRRGDIFVSHSPTPYEMRWCSPPGQGLDSITLHLGLETLQEAVHEVHGSAGATLEVMEFFGRDESLAHLCYACAEMLGAHTPGTARRVTELARLLATFVAEKYMGPRTQAPLVRGGLPVGQLRKVEQHVRTHLEEALSLETLAALVELSPFHFARVFKLSTGMTPLEFITRERIGRAQQLIRETSHSFLEIALEVGYSSPSHFAQVFRRLVGITPTQFRTRL